MNLLYLVTLLGNYLIVDRRPKKASLYALESYYS